MSDKIKLIKRTITIQVDDQAAMRAFVLEEAKKRNEEFVLRLNEKTLIEDDVSPVSEYIDLAHKLRPDPRKRSWLQRFQSVHRNA